MRKTVSAMEARRRFGELLEDVYRGDEVIIERNGKPMGVLVSPGLHAGIQRSRDEAMDLIKKARRRTKELGLTDEQIEQEAVAAVRAVRARKRARKTA